MQHIILAGATGQLGSAILKHLLAKNGVRVSLLLRRSSSRAKLDERAQVKIHEVDFDSETEIARACEGGDCVISALAGLENVIVKAQTSLVNGAIKAGVPRFIPSDFAIDYTKIPHGWNRNFDLRSRFRDHLESTPIKKTSILNGAFTNMLTGQAPFILFKFNRVLCWGDPQQKMDWTTIDNTAAYTAEAALDATTPRFLYIAGDEVSSSDLATIASKVTGKNFTIFRPGSPRALKALIAITKLLSPRSNEVYPPWQGMQYMHNMFTGLAKFGHLDNTRYQSIHWTSVEEYLRDNLGEAGLR